MNTTVPAEIAQFAAQVRAALSDLSDDELDELTEGLEADLAEAYAEDLARELPDPAAYAAELRTAAGLPPVEPTSGGVRGAFASFGHGMREVAADTAEALRGHPASRGVLEFLVAVRPIWWVVRAWVATWLVCAVFLGNIAFVPSSFAGLVLLVAAVVVSVQWGRGRWHGERIVPVVVVGNVVAAVMLVPVVAMAHDVDSYRDYVEVPTTDSRGITLDGQSVTNIYPYDAKGQPLEGVQLFDQDGRALAPALDWNRDECADCESGVAADGTTWQPASLETGEAALNVFPLGVVRKVLDELGTPVPGGADVGEPSVPRAPYVKVPALAEDAEQPSETVDEGDGR